MPPQSAFEHIPSPQSLQPNGILSSYSKRRGVGQRVLSQFSLVIPVVRIWSRHSRILASYSMR